MSSIHPTTVGSNGGNKYDSTPPLLLHSIYDAFDKNKRCPEIDVDHTVEFVERDVTIRAISLRCASEIDKYSRHVSYPLTVACIRKEDIYWTSVFFLNISTQFERLFWYR